jgi:hypothetical protein
MLLPSYNFYSTNFGLDGDYVVPGDFDGDHKFDFAVGRPGSSPTAPATFYFLNSQGFTYFEYGQTRDLVAPGDYDGDGKTDLALVREGASANDVLTWNIRMSGSNNSVFSVQFGLTGSDNLVQNDYDGDGKCDIAVWRNSNGHFYYLNSGFGFSMSDIWWGLPNDEPVASYDTH